MEQEERTIEIKENVLEEWHPIELLEQVEAFFKNPIKWTETYHSLERAFSSLSEEGQNTMRLLKNYLEAFSESMEPEHRGSLQNAVCDNFLELEQDDQKLFLSHLTGGSL